MRYTEPDQPAEESLSLSRENDALRREVEELRSALRNAAHAPPHAGPPIHLWHPSGLTIRVIFIGALVLAVGAFFAGYIPLQKRSAVIVTEAHEQEQALPRVEVIQVGRSSGSSELELPGNIQAITEAPVLARADGYLERRMVDIGDRVRAGQPVAEIDAPELGEQVRQAKATVLQAQAALDQALANYEQGKSDTELAHVTAQRWNNLIAKGAVSRQENDQYQAQYQSKLSSLQALDKAINVQRSSVAASQANVARLERMQSYQVVRAPFDGVITLRNVDVGALVTAGNTLLYRIAQTATLRIYVNVPQTNATSVRPGQAALLTVSNLPGREFTGTVARSSNALDPASRTLLVEIHVPNTDGALLPGMYAEVHLNSPRIDPPLLIPSDALIIRDNGAQVAVVRPDHSVHLQKIEVSRDYGDRVEVSGGLHEGDTIIPNPSDVAREGLKVIPVPPAKTPEQPPSTAAGK